MRVDLSDLLSRVDLEEWLDYEALDYRRTAGGDNLQLRVCPFCGDERWRVYMHRDKKLGVCFHAECAKRFNLFSFARAHLDADSVGTIRHFEDYGSRVLHLRRPPKPVLPLPTPSAILPASVPLPTPDGMTHPYLLDRKVLLSTQTLFGLRWCEDASWSYEDGDGGHKQMWFGKRILLPIHDLDGSVQTFVGRDATGKAQLRYLFPPRLPSASRYLYGSELAGEAGHLILGEGPFDAIAIHQALDHPDFADCAALGTFGLSIGHGDAEGDDQLGRLLRLRQAKPRRITMLWDGEAGALREALNAGDLLARHGFPVAIGLLPPDSDPGELDTRAIRHAIETALPWDATLRVRLTLKSPYK